MTSVAKGLCVNWNRPDRLINPVSADVDDGLDDGLEFNQFNDPLAQDSDGDDLLDGLEVHGARGQSAK